MSVEVRPKVLICASGSVATVKIPELVTTLIQFAEVKVVLTKSADFFLDKARQYDAVSWKAFEDIQAQVEILRDEDEWRQWLAIGDDIQHIQLKDWADVLLVAPMSANTMAKLANGLSDNLLTSVARAWPNSKPLLYAPAMNTDMWNHPVTAKHLSALDEFGYHMIKPITKKLACGDTGQGALATVETIVLEVKKAFGH